MVPDADSPYLFISYASRDRETVLRLAAGLQQAGVRLWLDQAAIDGGANYGLEIADGIRDCAGLVLMCSAAALA